MSNSNGANHHTSITSMSIRAITLFVTLEACCTCLELYRIIITSLILKSCRLMRCCCRCQLSNDGMLLVSISLLLPGLLHSLYGCPCISQYWIWTSYSGPQSSHPEQCGPMQLVSTVHFVHSEVAKYITAVAAKQTIAIDTSSLLASRPCSILDVKHWVCFSANDIPWDVVKMNSLKIDAIHEG